jgi:hypothetical protein
MSRLVIRLKKKADGSADVCGIREDGSITWRQPPDFIGPYFPLRDLTHFAAEKVLGYCCGVFGQIIKGWDFNDFAEPWPKGKLTRQTAFSELIVDVFDAECDAGEEWSIEEFNARADQICKSRGVNVCSALTNQDLNAIREERTKLLSQWVELLVGNTMELEFTLP